ncbi:hypothetical protein HF521_012451 [Silurus meridionalis]|uniref:Uncharacterized protein n=1 Tax=Silurus meridionalis TaxID=175797 RepID=A0A8T0AEG4_SILME|nr:hypothetical protein HF521_012451 [Silurus meridionalis]
MVTRSIICLETFYQMHKNVRIVVYNVKSSSDQKGDCSDAQTEMSTYTDGGTSCSVCLINPVEQHTQIKMEEPKNEDSLEVYLILNVLGGISGGETSGSVDTVDQLSGFHIKLVKKEESEDEDFPVQKQSGEKMSSYQSSPASGVHFLIQLNSASTSTSQVATPRNMRD